MEELDEEEEEFREEGEESREEREDFELGASNASDDESVTSEQEESYDPKRP